MWLCFLTVSAGVNREECTLSACHALSTFSAQLEAMKHQEAAFKKLERRLRSLEQTSKSHLSQFNNKVAINWIVVVSLDNFICRRSMVKLR